MGFPADTYDWIHRNNGTNGRRMHWVYRFTGADGCDCGYGRNWGIWTQRAYRKRVHGSIRTKPNWTHRPYWDDRVYGKYGRDGQYRLLSTRQRRSNGIHGHHGSHGAARTEPYGSHVIHRTHDRAHWSTRNDRVCANWVHGPDGPDGLDG
jgi:hypothetical protein